MEKQIIRRPGLFIKPAFAEASADKPCFDPSINSEQAPLSMTNEILFSKEYPEIHSTISFRSLNLNKDLATIHQWVQEQYAHEYWQMTGPFSQFYANYQCMELNPYSHSFVGLLDEQVICQFDVYSVLADELRDHIPYHNNDCGFHLLMSPNKVPIAGLTVCLVKAFLDYYFSFSEAQRMYAEPDINNEKSIVLLERCGFERIKTVEMSYKVAHVYCLTSPGLKATPS